MHTPFLYYCDFRAQIRKTPEDILIRNCQFENPDSLIRLEFDGEHKWCCNRSLKSITFEDCSFVGLGKTATLHGDAEEPVILRMKNCTISPREEAKGLEILMACNFERIEWENVQVEGYTEPTFLLKTHGDVILKNCTPIVLKKEV